MSANMEVKNQRAESIRTLLSKSEFYSSCAEYANADRKETEEILANISAAKYFLNQAETMIVQDFYDLK